ncbi:hypothetical protein QWZ06_09470 [Chryseobacterium tructae]|nr:hypothetical protein [Chryseobacterium tructae]MDN3692487.1 hypothetical protein [Chryseobacterium tructae]
MKPRIIMLLLLCFFTIVYGQNKKESKNQTNSKFDSLKITAEKLMKQKKLNGLSVAVFEDYKVIWTNQWGIKEAGSQLYYEKFSSIWQSYLCLCYNVLQFGYH